MGGQSGIAELPESLAGIQEVTVQVSGVEGGGIEKVFFRTGLIYHD